MSHSVLDCAYHIELTPKYRCRILKGKVKEEMEESLNVFCEQKGCFITELDVQEDHVLLLVLIPPKVSVSDLGGALMG